MAKDKITEYDATAANNTDVGGVNLAENSMNPSDVNNAIREVLSHQKEAFGSGTPLFVDQTNNRVGVNKTPTVALDVSGGVTYTGDLISSTAGTSNLRIGVNAGNSITSGGNYNVTIGDEAGTALTTGDNNTAVGYLALSTATTASDNTAIGRRALRDNTSGYNNVSVGVNSSMVNTEGNTNTAVGTSSLSANTTGSSNVAVGDSALLSNTTGDKNTALGKDALKENTTASKGVAVGREALKACTTGSGNVAVGHQSLILTTTASSNTAVGQETGYVLTTGVRNTLIGQTAGYALATSNSDNTFLGQGAGNTITSGDANTIIGRFNGNQDGLDIRTSSNNIVLSDGDGNVQLAIHGDGNVSMGDQKTRFTSSATLNVDQLGSGFPLLCHRDGTGDGVQISFRNDNGQVGRINTSGSATSYVTSSDYRLKENVVDMTGAIDRVKQLLPKRFNFIADADTTVDGFIAHEAQAIIPEAITGEKDAVDADGNIEAQGIDQSKLVPLLTGALKEAIAKIETLETKVKALEG